jgi:hypothetical protein
MKSDEIKRTNSVILSYKLGACTPLDPNLKAGSGSLTQNNADPDPFPKPRTDPATPHSDL